MITCNCGGRGITRNPLDGGAMICICRYQAECRRYQGRYADAVELKDSPLLRDIDAIQTWLVEVKSVEKRMQSWPPHIKLALAQEYWLAKKEGREPLIWDELDAWKLLDVKYGDDLEMKFRTFLRPELLIIWAPAFPKNLHFFSEFHQLLSLRASRGRGTWVVGTNLTDLLKDVRDPNGVIAVSTEFRLLWESLLTPNDKGKNKMITLTASDTAALKITKDPVLSTKGVGVGGYDMQLMRTNKDIDSRISRVVKENDLVTTNEDNIGHRKSKSK